jgi:hypothetical protein
MKSIVRIELPASLRLLASVGHEVNVSITGPVTQRAILDALEADYPMLQGTIRDHTSKLRRPFIRFLCQRTGPIARVSRRSASRFNRSRLRTISYHRRDRWWLVHLFHT